jgi:uncharacterized membrane protein
MTADTVLFMAFGVPWFALVAGCLVYSGKRSGIVSQREFLIIEAGLAVLALASLLLAHDIGKRM